MRLVAAWFRSVGRRAIETADEKVAWLVFVASIPAALAGAVGEKAIEDHLGEPWQIAIYLAVFGDPSLGRRPPPRHAGSKTSASGPRSCVGARSGARADARRLRSGITITAGRFLKLDRDSAARLSFFLLSRSSSARCSTRG